MPLLPNEKLLDCDYTQVVHTRKWLASEVASRTGLSAEVYRLCQYTEETTWLVIMTSIGFNMVILQRRGNFDSLFLSSFPNHVLAPKMLFIALCPD